MYVYIPYRNQSRLPVFDSATPDLNTIELFRPNRFVGIDRIGDSNSLTMGATTQWFDNASGARYLSATLGAGLLSAAAAGDRARSDAATPHHLEPDCRDQPDRLPALEPAGRRGLQPIAQSRRTGRGHAAVPGEQQVRRQHRLPVSLRCSAAGRWLGGLAGQPHWDIYARAVYSLYSAAGPRRHRARIHAGVPSGTAAARPGSIEDFVGFQYRGYCWSIRAVAQHSISTRTGQTDTGVSLQVELTGLSNVGNGGVGTGSGVSTFLEQSIRGYSSSATPTLQIRSNH